MDDNESIEGLAAYVELLRTSPGLPAPSGIYFYHKCSSTEELAVAARYLGTVEKTVDENCFNVRRRFGPHTVEYYVRRDAVCSAIVVGRKKVKVTKTVVPAVTKEVEEEVDDVRWECPKSLLSLMSKE